MSPYDDNKKQNPTSKLYCEEHGHDHKRNTGEIQLAIQNSHFIAHALHVSSNSVGEHNRGLKRGF